MHLMHKILCLGMALWLVACSSTVPTEPLVSPDYLGSIAVTLAEDSDSLTVQADFLGCASFRFVDASTTTLEDGSVLFSSDIVMDSASCATAPEDLALVPLNLASTLGDSPLFGMISDAVLASVRYPDAVDVSDQEDALNEALSLNGSVIPVAFKTRFRLSASESFSGGIILGIFAGLPIEESEEPDPEDPLETSIADLVSGEEQLSSLLGLLNEAQRMRLASQGDFTLFAPVNSAIADSVAAGLDEEALAALLDFHIVTEIVLEEDLRDLVDADLAGIMVSLAPDGTIQLAARGNIDAEGDAVAARIVASPLRADNGVVYLLDMVLLPDIVNPGNPNPDDFSATDRILSNPDSTTPPAESSGDILERRLTTPTGWWWFNNASIEVLEAKIDEGFRIFDLEVNSTNPLRFSAVLVQNSGVHDSGWWWYYGLSAAQVSEKLSENQARLLDIESYFVNGQRRFAVVMVPNSGDNAKSWWYYYGISFDQVAEKLSENQARLIDIDRQVINGVVRYNVVMVANQGDDAKAWWYYSGLSAEQVSARLSQNQARLTDIEPYQSANGLRFNVIMERSEGQAWWWYFGVTMEQVNAFADQNGARLIDVERYQTNVGTRYAVIMLRNSNDLSESMRQVLEASQTGGAYGAYLRQINGPTLASLQADFVFEPASSIKTLHHVHAMRQVDLGMVSLDTQINWFQGDSTICPDDSNPEVSDTLQVGLAAMMRNSHNPWTQAMRVYFGEANINATAQELGMTNTRLRHRIGCAFGDDGAINRPNEFSLRDASRLFEAVADGYLGTRQDTFYSLMTTALGTLNTVIDEEAAALGLDSSVVEEFRRGVRTVSKGGSYNFSGQSYRSLVGWLSLPFRDANGNLAPREYTFGVFIHQADSLVEGFSIRDDARNPLLRAEIAKALATYQ